jgi:hypothetical protein
MAIRYKQAERITQAIPPKHFTDDVRKTIEKRVEHFEHKYNKKEEERYKVRAMMYQILLDKDVSKTFI